MRNEATYIQRNLMCINNKDVEKRFTIGEKYLSLYDYLENQYCIEKDDLGGTKSIADKKGFKEIEE